MEVAILLIILAFLYLFIQYKIRSKMEFEDGEHADLSVPTYPVQIKEGDYQVVINHVGNQKQAIAKIITRYNSKLDYGVIDNMLQLNDIVVVDSIWIYAAEDMKDELERVGATVTIEKM